MGDDDEKQLIDLSWIKDPELKDILQRLGDKVSAQDIPTQAKETANEILQGIAPHGKIPPQQLWIPVCPMPTELCRTSPFFPLNRRALGQRDYIRDKIITETAWGRIIYSGPRLSTYEEDALVAALALIGQIRDRIPDQVEGKATYSYNGPMLPFVKLMGFKKSGKNYRISFNALKLMVGAVFEIETNSGRRVVNSILTMASMDDTTGNLRFTVNPYFYEIYCAGGVTLLDVLIRKHLKSPIAKALYRFSQSHREQEWRGHFLTLAHSLNLNTEKEERFIKRDIRRAIRELVSIGFLSHHSRFLKADVLKLVRAEEHTIPHNPQAKGDP